MRPTPPSRSLAPNLAFQFVAGDVSLDFVNTVDWTSAGLTEERLTDYGRLVEWAETAGAVTPAEAARLRRGAQRNRAGAAKAYERARHCRRVLRDLFVAVSAGQRPPEVLEEFNELLAEVHAHLALGWPTEPRNEAALRWSWRGAETRLDSVLWPVIRAAAALLTSRESPRVRICGGVDCGWMYVDRSRNRLRRWCQMETCGTREKSRRRADRRAATLSGTTPG